MISKRNISPTILYHLKKLFTDQKWMIEDDNADSTFNCFCEMFSFLSDEQQNCLLELTKKFLRIDFSQYHYYLKRALQNVPKQSLDGVDKVYVLPLLTNEDTGKTKSSQLLAYILKGWQIRAKDILGISAFHVFEKKEWLKPVLNLNNWKLLLVDDFIGTGETAETALNELLQETGVDKNRIIILALVAQETGYQRLTSQGVMVVCSDLRNKGISDEYADPVRQEYLAVMQSIEDMLSIKPQYRYGYKSSEALVTFIRTPNNTFPVYWGKSKMKDKKWSAPFPRYD